MDYEILRAYSGGDMADFYRAYRLRRSLRPAPGQASPAMQSALAAVFLLMGCAGIWFSLGREGTLHGELLRWVSVFWLGLGGLLLVGGLGVTGGTRSRRERQAAENSKGYSRCSETGFATSIGDAAYACNYAAVEAVLEDEGHFFLFMPQNAGHILCKSAFTQGDPERFRAFLAERTGMEVIQIPRRQKGAFI